MVLLFAAALLLQDKTAEDTFKEIEKSLEKARTVSIAFKSEMNVQVRIVDERGTLKSSGTILIKEGNKASIAVTVTSSNPALGGSGSLTVSNGLQMTYWDSNGGPTVKAPVSTPTTLNARVLSRFLRVGIGGMGIVWVGTEIPPNLKDPNDPKAESKLSNFRYGPEDGKARTLTFRVNQGEFNGDRYPEGEGKIWYDPTSYRLLKRTGSYSSGDVSFSETYGEFTFNADIPDEKFNLPTDKK